MCYLTIPEGEKRSEEEVQVEIGKEIKLKHKAPVVSMFVVDKDGMPLLGDVMEDKDKGKFQCFISFGGRLVGVLCFNLSFTAEQDHVVFLDRQLALLDCRA